MTSARQGRGAPLAALTRAVHCCERAVLLYDSGRVRQGRIAEMLTQDNLELPYQCRLGPACGPDAGSFVPR